MNLQPRVSRLYWRMFVYTAAAIAAFVLLSAASILVVASAELENYIQTRHSRLGLEAADVLTRGGLPALQRWMRSEATLPKDVALYVVDESGHDVLGRQVPAPYANFVQRFVVARPDEDTGSYRPIRLTPQLVGPGGEHYAFLVMPRGIGIFGSRATTAAVVAAALLVIAIVAFLVARALTRPIGEIQTVVRKLASGQTDARVPAALGARRDELGVLAGDVNTMADQISSLLASRQQLMREISHELRSPLARLQAAVALAAARESLGATDRTRIEAEIARLDRQIGDLLRLTRLDAVAGMAQHLVRVDELLREIVRDEELEAAARGCAIALRHEGDLALVGDPDLLRSGFENLVRNAIRHGAANGTIDVAARRDGRDVVVTVADRGPGVPAEHLGRIFEPYFRVPVEGPAAEGTGLGLAIARRVFQRHQGDATAANRERGGLVVTVRIPAAQMV